MRGRRSADRIDEVRPFIEQTAAARGLVCFDPRSVTLDDRYDSIEE